MRVRWLAGAFGLLALLAACVAIAAAWTLGWSFADAVEAFVVSNIIIGVSFALCGALIAWHQPRSALGWLYLVGGLCQSLTAAAGPMAELLDDRGAPTWLVRLDLTVWQYAWPINIGIAIPLSLLLLPDGKLASPRWRWVAWVVAVTALLFVLEIGLSPEGIPGLPPPYLVLDSYDQYAWLWTLSEVRLVLSVVVGVACLAYRYWRGTEVVRRQLLWLVGAAAVILLAVTPWALVAGTPMAVLFTIPLLPGAVAVAVLRHQLLDIRLVIARGLTFALLSGLVLAAYAALVIVLSGVASALLVALLALPLRSRLQAAVDRLFYGERRSPLTVASRVGRSMQGGLADTLAELGEALRLPYVGVHVDDVVLASGGELAGPSASMPLDGATLVVGLRSGEKRLAPADRRVLALMSGPLSTAVRATSLLEDLQLSRERLVVAREEERRRLRRELHDGLGPLLTGVALSADAASNLAGPPSEALQERLTAVRRDSRSAILEVRRIVDNLGSPALDELGLLQALRLRAAQTTRRSDGSALTAVVEAGSDLPPLPAAVELAAYRIATEALTNAVRHSAASTVVLRVGCDDALHCEVLDNGIDNGPWQPGVGIVGMRERAAELGGTCEVGPGPSGGHVRLSLPVVVA